MPLFESVCVCFCVCVYVLIVVEVFILFQSQSVFVEWMIVFVCTCSGWACWFSSSLPRSLWCCPRRRELNARIDPSAILTNTNILLGWNYDNRNYNQSLVSRYYLHKNHNKTNFLTSTNNFCNSNNNKNNNDNNLLDLPRSRSECFGRWDCMTAR